MLWGANDVVVFFLEIVNRKVDVSSHKAHNTFFLNTILRCENSTLNGEFLKTPLKFEV